MESKKSSFVSFCGFIGGTVIVIFGIAMVNSKVKEVWKVMHILNKADKIMPITNPQQYRKSSIYFLFAAYTTLIFMLTFNRLSLVEKFETRYLMNVDRDLENFIFLTVFDLSLFTIVIHTSFYLHIIYFIQIRISLLNTSLSQLKVQSNLSDTTFIERLTEQNSRSFSSRISAEEQNTSSNLNPNTFQTSDIVNTVFSLTDYQDKIFQAVDTINSSTAYGVHILMFHSSLGLVITLYNILDEFMEDSVPKFIVIQVIWLLFHIGRVLIIVEPCESCMNTHKKTAHLVCQLLICDFDEDVKNALIILFDHINSYEFNFTAAGLFTLNRSLLTSIGGAVTTYLIIVYQFNVD